MSDEVLEDYAYTVTSIHHIMKKTQPRAVHEQLDNMFVKALFGNVSTNEYVNWALELSDNKESKTFLCRLREANGSKHCKIPVK